jgi:hypothetical protein
MCFPRLQVFTHALTNLFPQGPPDHPAVEALVIDFFYRGTACLAVSFPDQFSWSVPKCALALAMSCVGVLIANFDLALAHSPYQSDSKLSGRIL